MRPFVAVLFEAGKAAKLSSAGAQLGEFTTLRLTLAGAPSHHHSPLDAFGFSILATSVAAIMWGPDPTFSQWGVQMCTDPIFSCHAADMAFNPYSCCKQARLEVTLIIRCIYGIPAGSRHDSLIIDIT